MNSLLQLYPRGFLGEAFNSSVPGVVGDRPRNKPVAHPSIETLYVQYIKRNVSMESADFRKNVLIVALGAFGTKNFDHWVISQQQSPVFGDLHNQFIDDTLQFIETGRRQLSIENWDALIGENDRGERLIGYSDVAKEFFGITADGYSRFPRNRAITDVIQLWVSKPGGFGDMLCTMHVLFGNK